MKVFEFHFNPKLNPDWKFDSFCYEPDNVFEKKLGSLYMVGLLRDALGKNARLLARLAEFIKDKYYQSTTVSAQRALKYSLKAGNKYLEGLTKKGDVSWLGNLSFLVLFLKDFHLNFTKVGEMKILLVRQNQVIDIDDKVKLEEMEPYPLKVFTNTISGKLAENDVVLVMTNDVYYFLKNNNVLSAISRLQEFDEQALAKMLEDKKMELAKVSGVMLAVVLKKESVLSKRQEILQQQVKEFSLRQTFQPILNLFEKVNLPQMKLPKMKLKTTKATKPAKGKKVSVKVKDGEAPSDAKAMEGKGAIPLLERIKLPTVSVSFDPMTLLNASKDLLIAKIRTFKLNQKTISIIAFIFVLLLGYIFFANEQRQKIQLYTKELQTIEEKFIKAESLLLLQDTQTQSFQQANSLLKEAWNQISDLSKRAADLPFDFTHEIENLTSQISQELFKINKLQEVESPERIFEFSAKEFVPQKIFVKDSTIYAFSPYKKNIFIIKENGETEIMETSRNINFAQSFGDAVYFLSKPERLLILKNGSVQVVTLQSPYQDFEVKDFGIFNGNIYLLDSKTGEIIKYPYYGTSLWGLPQLWLAKTSSKVEKAQSFTIDGSVWILEKNEIKKYYAGSFTQDFNFEVFPQPKDISQIYTSPSLSYLYLLEPAEKRIIILDKQGQIIKQLRSESFDNLLDFSVSSDGQNIYLLNGLTIYKVTL